MDFTRELAAARQAAAAASQIILDIGQKTVAMKQAPAHDRQVYASRGGGCWRRDKGAEAVRVHVTSTASLSQSCLIQSHFKSGRPPSKEVAAIKPKAIIETYSAGVKLARVADGTADL